MCSICVLVKGTERVKFYTVKMKQTYSTYWYVMLWSLQKDNISGPKTRWKCTKKQTEEDPTNCLPGGEGQEMAPTEAVDTA